MSLSGATAYRRTGIDTSVAAADPHQMILMLYDGVLEAVRRAATYMQQGRPAEKGQMLGKAIRIVEEGLKASLDPAAGGMLAQQLATLYDYVSLRLLQSNLRNDAQALVEVTRLLEDLRSAWAQIGKSASAAASIPAAAPAAEAASSAAARLRMIDGTADGPRRAFAVTA